MYSGKKKTKFSKIDTLINDLNSESEQRREESRSILKEAIERLIKESSPLR